MTAQQLAAATTLSEKGACAAAFDALSQCRGYDWEFSGDKTGWITSHVNASANPEDTEKIINDCAVSISAEVASTIQDSILN